jgi:small subunit ribosomal protein S17
MSRTVTGTVVSDKPDQTIVVAIERRVNHPIYRKAYTITKKIHVHDPENTKKVGDVVTVAECPPRSALKRWEVVGDAPDTNKKPSAKQATPKNEEAK